MILVHCIYIKGSQVILSTKNSVFLFFLNIDFFLANIADLDEMLHSVAFNMGLHCLQISNRLWVSILQRVKDLRQFPIQSAQILRACG